MTATDKTSEPIDRTMSESPQAVVREKKSLVSPSLGDKFLQKFFKQPKTVIVRTWIIGKDKEIMIDEEEVKLGVLDVTIKGFSYTIIYDAIQNQGGILVYNTKHRVANGALRYRLDVDKEVDAKARKDMAQRDNLHAIWSRWNLPLWIALIAIMGCVILGVFVGVLSGALSKSEGCLSNENCMVSKIAEIRAKQATEEQTVRK